MAKWEQAPVVEDEEPATMAMAGDLVRPVQDAKPARSKWESAPIVGEAITQQPAAPVATTPRNKWESAPIIEEQASPDIATATSGDLIRPGQGRSINPAPPPLDFREANIRAVEAVKSSPSSKYLHPNDIQANIDQALILMGQPTRDEQMKQSVAKNIRETSGFVENAATAMQSTIAGFGEGAEAAGQRLVGGDLSDEVKERQARAVNLPYEPNSVSGVVGELGGNIYTMLPMLASSPLGLALFGASAGGDTMIDAQEQRELGREVSVAKEMTGAAGNAAIEIGMEYLGQRVWRSLGKAAGPLLRRVGDAMGKNSVPELAKALGAITGRLGITAAEGGAEEGLTQLAQNWITQKTIDPSREVTEGAGRATLMGALQPIAMASIDPATYQGRQQPAAAAPTTPSTGLQNPVKPAAEPQNADLGPAPSDQEQGTLPPGDTDTAATPTPDPNLVPGTDRRRGAVVDLTPERLAQRATWLEGQMRAAVVPSPTAENPRATATMPDLGVRLTDAPTDQHRALVDNVKQRYGLNVAFITEAQGRKLPRYGAYDAVGRVAFIDAMLPFDGHAQSAVAKAAVLHELSHDIETNDPKLYRDFAQALEVADPQGYQQRVESYRQASGGQAFDQTSEAVATAVEDAARSRLFELIESDPKQARAEFERIVDSAVKAGQKPTVIARIKDALARLLRSITGGRVNLSGSILPSPDVVQRVQQESAEARSVFAVWGYLDEAAKRAGVRGKEAEVVGEGQPLKLKLGDAEADVTIAGEHQTASPPDRAEPRQQQSRLLPANPRTGQEPPASPRVEARLEDQAQPADDPRPLPTPVGEQAVPEPPRQGQADEGRASRPQPSLGQSSPTLEQAEQSRQGTASSRLSEGDTRPASVGAEPSPDSITPPPSAKGETNVPPPATPGLPQTEKATAPDVAPPTQGAPDAPAKQEEGLQEATRLTQEKTRSSREAGVAPQSSAVASERPGSVTGPQGLPATATPDDTASWQPRQLQITAEAVREARRKGATSQSMRSNIAKIIADQIPGATITEAKSTNSVYISVPGAPEQIRLSDHSKYGMNRPTHIMGWRSDADLALKLDRAVRAAVSGKRDFKSVPTWDQLSPTPSPAATAPTDADTARRTRLQTLTGPQLHTEAKKAGLRTSAKMDKAELVDLLMKQGTGFKGTPIKGQAGREGDLVLADGSKRRVRYMLVDAKNLIPSHDPGRNFARNDNADANERPYHDPVQGRDSRDTVRKIADNPTPALLTTDTPTAVDGPPIIAATGQVLGGNARSMAIQLAYSRGGRAAQTIRSGMVEAAEKFGLGRTDLLRPVIVRVIDDPGRPGELSRLLNEAMTTGKAGATDATSRAGKVSTRTASLLTEIMVPNKQGDMPTVREVLAEPDNSGRIIRSLITDGAWSDTDTARHVDSSTKALDEAGKSIIENLLLGRVVTDPGVLARVRPGVRQKVLSSLAPIIQADAKPQTSLTDPLSKAIEAYGGWKDSGLPLTDYFRDQQSLQPPPGFGDPEVMALAGALDRISPAKFRTAVTEYLSAMGEAVGGQNSMFGGGEKVDRAAAIREAFTTTPGGDVQMRIAASPDAQFAADRYNEGHDDEGFHRDPITGGSTAIGPTHGPDQGGQGEVRPDAQGRGSDRVAPDRRPAPSGSVRVTANGRDYPDTVRRRDQATHHRIRQAGQRIADLQKDDARSAQVSTTLIDALRRPDAAITDAQLATIVDDLRDRIPVIDASQLGVLPELKSGQEASVYHDEARGAVYKLLGVKDGAVFNAVRVGPVQEVNADGTLTIGYSTGPLTVVDLFDRVAIANAHGGVVFTEIAAVTRDGDVVLKQPYVPGLVQGDRNLSNQNVAGLGLRWVKLGGVMHKDDWIGGVAAGHADGSVFIIDDLHDENLMVDDEGRPFIIDAAARRLDTTEAMRVRNAMRRQGVQFAAERYNDEQEQDDGTEPTTRSYRRPTPQARRAAGDAQGPTRGPGRSGQTRFALRQGQTDRQQEHLSVAAFKARYPEARVLSGPDFYRVEHPGGGRVDYRLVGRDYLRNLVTSNPYGFAESIAGSDGGLPITFPDGQTIIIPDDADGVLNHPRATDIFDAFIPAAAYTPATRRALLERDGANMEFVEEESFHAAFRQTLTEGERQAIIDEFGNDENAYHLWYKIRADTSGPATPTDSDAIRILKAIRDDRTWNDRVTGVDQDTIRFSAKRDLPPRADAFSITSQDIARAEAFSDNPSAAFAYGVKEFAVQKRDKPIPKAWMRISEVNEVRDGFNAAKAGASEATRQDRAAAFDRVREPDRAQLALFAVRRQHYAGQLGLFEQTAPESGRDAEKAQAKPDAETRAATPTTPEPRQKPPKAAQPSTREDVYDAEELDAAADLLATIETGSRDDATQMLVNAPDAVIVAALEVEDMPLRVREKLNAELDRRGLGVRFAADRDQTDTPEFKRWFGNSVVTHNGKPMSEGGKPLVVYHGTQASFNRFSPSKAGQRTQLHSGRSNFFFTSDQVNVGGYAVRGKDSLKDMHPNDRPNVMPVYLAMQNPLVVDAEGKSWYGVTNDAIKQARRDGNDGVIVRNVLDLGDARLIGRPPTTTYIAFSPTQIKSATGNQGSFDSTNPDIRYAAPRHRPGNINNPPKNVPVQTWAEFQDFIQKRLDKLNADREKRMQGVEALKGVRAAVEARMKNPSLKTAQAAQTEYDKLSDEAKDRWTLPAFENQIQRTLHIARNRGVDRAMQMTRDQIVRTAPIKLGEKKLAQGARLGFKKGYGKALRIVTKHVLAATNAKKNRADLIRWVKNYVPAPLQGRLLKAVANAGTNAGLASAIRQMRRVVSQHRVRQQLTALKGKSRQRFLLKLALARRTQVRALLEQGDAIRKAMAGKRGDITKNEKAVADLEQIAQQIDAIVQQDQQDRSNRAIAVLKDAARTRRESVRNLKNLRQLKRDARDSDPKAGLVNRFRQAMLTPMNWFGAMGERAYDTAVRRFQLGEDLAHQLDVIDQKAMATLFEKEGRDPSALSTRKMSSVLHKDARLHKLTLSGKTVTLDESQIIALIGMSKSRPDAVFGKGKRPPTPFSLANSRYKTDTLTVTSADIDQLKQMDGGVYERLADGLSAIMGAKAHALDDVTWELRGQGMEPRVYYWPMPRNLVQSATAGTPEGYKDRSFYGEIKQRFLENLGFTRQTTDAKTPFLLGDTFQTFHSHTHDANLLIAQAKNLRNLSMVFEHKTMREAMVNALGTDSQKRLRRYMEHVSGMAVTDKNREARMLSRNVAGALITANVKSWARNLIGGTTSLYSEFETQDWAAGVSHAFSRKTADRLIADSPFFERRHKSEPEKVFATTGLDEGGSLAPAPLSWRDASTDLAVSLIKGRLKQAGVSMKELTAKIKGMTWADQRVAVAAYHMARSEISRKNKGIAEADLHALAVARAEEAFRNTQNGNSPTETAGWASWAREGSLGQMFTMFSSEPAKQLNYFIRALRSGDPARQARAVVAMSGNILSSAAVGMAGRGGAMVLLSALAGQWLLSDDDEEKMLKLAAYDVARNTMGLIPFADTIVDVVQAVERGGQASDAIRTIPGSFAADLIDAGQLLYQGMSKWGSGEVMASGKDAGKSKSATMMKRGAERLTMSLATLAGIPLLPAYYDVKKLGQALDKLHTAEADQIAALRADWNRREKKAKESKEFIPPNDRRMGAALDKAGEAINRLNKLANETGGGQYREKARELAEQVMKSLEQGKAGEALSRAGSANAQSKGSVAMLKLEEDR